MDDFKPESEIQMPVGYITLNVLDSCFKICKTSNIKDNKRRVMTPCNIFYSSKSMMEMLEKKKFMINNEQNINIDKTSFKFSLKDMMSFNDMIEYVMKDLNMFTEDSCK